MIIIDARTTYGDTSNPSKISCTNIYGFLAYEAAVYFQNKGYAVLLAEQLGQRVAIGSIIIFLLAGLWILLKVNDPTEKFLDT